MLIFLSGKMTGLSDYGRAAFRAAESELTDAGNDVLNPAILPACVQRERCLPITLAMLDAAEAVYMLRGWEDSPGARIEHEYAKYQGKTILYE